MVKAKPESGTKTSLRRRYIGIWLVCCGMMASSVGLSHNAYGVFYTPVSQALGVGRGAVAMHATLTGVVTGLCSPIAVRLLRRVHVKVLVAGGAMLACSSYILMAFATEVWMFNLLGVLRGIGDCGIYLPIITMLLGNWFKKGQGTIVGLTMSFSGIAGAILSPALTAIILRYGYQTAYFASAAFIAAVTLPGAMLWLELKPEDAGICPYGAGTEQGCTAERPARLVNRLRVFSPVYLTLGVMAVFVSTVSGLTSHLSGMAENIGAGAAVGAAMISSAMVGNILFKFLSGWLSDRIGVFRAFSVSLVVAAAGSVTLYLGGTNTAVLLAGAFIFGAIYSVSAVGVAAGVRQIYGDNQYGDGYSVLAAVMCICPAIAMSAVGYLYDLTGGYSAAVGGCVALSAASFVLWQAVRRMSDKMNTWPDA
ncbi:MAG TPA: MFS transporter [Candidatus Acidoferrum sp.]|nr:MFS transporter [Candidatus Acidoferrum sp.]